MVNRFAGAELALPTSQVLGTLEMTRLDETDGGYAVMLSPREKDWAWTIYDLDGEARAAGRDTDRQAAWRSGLFAAGAIGALERMGERRF